MHQLTARRISQDAMTPMCRIRNTNLISSSSFHKQWTDNYSLIHHNKRLITTPMHQQIYNNFKTMKHNETSNQNSSYSLNIMSNQCINSNNRLLYIYHSKRSFAKFKFKSPSEYIKQKRREFIPPMEDRDLERSITWKTKIGGLTLLSFAGFMYWWTCHNVCILYNLELLVFVCSLSISLHKTHFFFGVFFCLLMPVYGKRKRKGRKTTSSTT